MDVNIEMVANQARKEIQEEDFRMAVDKAKEEIRNKKHWFPWKIQLIITRR